ncbi:hypothetical protein [Niastella populi]|uniref:Uncharacterized protein n=1 Tax=Niastella populi TaxID=550983 RepID=A0A1V9GBF4_9BACT|nr:hypothetical protein [Niastella populi]OQP67798.1 hypothetical protein A4R26_32745 [Niastella populi]
MQYSIKRYDLRKNLISTGLLIVRSEGQTTHLTYADSEITESVSELYHPIVALESLREVLERKYESIIGCNGCRIDSAYRATGGYGTYIVNYGEPASKKVSLFEPTDEIAKLCTVEEHKDSYNKWINSLGQTEP